jgi:threonine aldolase
MRQAGVIAAAGIVALTEMRELIGADHVNARALAEGMARLPGVELDPALVETNILFMRVTAMPAAAFEAALEAEGVRTLATGVDQCRFVCHHDVDREDVERALEVMAAVLPGVN